MMACCSCLSGTSGCFCAAYSCLTDFSQSLLRLKPSTSVGLQQAIGLDKKTQECVRICKSQYTKFKRWPCHTAAFQHSAGGPGEP